MCINEGVSESEREKNHTGNCEFCAMRLFPLGGIKKSKKKRIRAFNRRFYEQNETHKPER